jgi:hypothetical protein
LLYHAALFGPVRWTNLWYDEDSFGGPIDPRLGNGIQNYEVSDGGWSKWWLAAHTSYLKHPTDDHPRGATATLRMAMDLSPAGMPRCPTTSGEPPVPDPDSAYHTALASPSHDPEFRADPGEGEGAVIVKVKVPVIVKDPEVSEFTVICPTEMVSHIG